VGLRLDPESPVVRQTLAEVVQAHPEVTFRFEAIVRGIRTILPRGDERLQPGDQVFILTRPKYVTPVARLMGKSKTTMQHVMVLGGTRVGANVAQNLSKSERKRVKLIEPNAERAAELSEHLSDVLVIHGDATDIDLLVTEGLSDMDAFVAVTDDEESNLVTCLMAKHLGVYKTVGLLSKAAYIPISQAIGLDAAVSTKLAVSREIRRFLRGKHVLSVATVHGMDAEILEIEAEPRSPVVCCPIRNLDLPDGILIGAVVHDDGVEIATGTTEIQPSDRAIVFVLPNRVRQVEDMFEA
jgi:trk system potassium uptake protein TrkA